MSEHEEYYSYKTGPEIDAILSAAQAHLADSTNPHGVTIAQIGGSNRNLLDNWDFRNPVNQRGLSSYTEDGYTIDRWKLIHDGGAMTVTVGSGYISLNKTSAGYSAWLQPIEPWMIPLLRGRKVTLSVWIYGQASSVSLTLTVPASGAIDTENLSLGSGFVCDLIGDDGNTFLWFRIYNNTTTDGLSFYATKMEISGVSTLANDPPADYREELRKCQRYAEKIDSQKLLSPVGLCSMTIPFKATKRIAPTYAFTDYPGNANKISLIKNDWSGEHDASPLEVISRPDYLQINYGLPSGYNGFEVFNIFVSADL